MPSLSTIPTTKHLIDLMQEGKLHPEGFLDILEMRLEEDPESITSEDLHDLYRSDRLTPEEYAAHEKSWPDDVSEVDPQDELEGLVESYGREPLE